MKELKIAVINGSPTGDLSSTLQAIKYVEKNFPEHRFRIFHVAKDIKRIESRTNDFRYVVEGMADSDGIIWSFPVYFLLVSSQLKRFIEMLFERNMKNLLKDKYSAAVTTSGSLFDFAAHDYVRAICDDLNMRYVDGFSTSIWGLMRPDEKTNLLTFSKNYFRFIQEKLPTERSHPPVAHTIREYTPSDVNDAQRDADKRVALIIDRTDHDSNLNRMVDTFVKSISAEVDLIDLNQVDIRHGCLGCQRCYYDGKCVQKDDFRTILEARLLPVTGIVFAAEIRDRYFSSKMKVFFDRLHPFSKTPFLNEKQAGFLVSGPITQIPNIRIVCQAMMECTGANLLGFVTDEYDTSGEVTARIETLARQIVWAMDERYQKPNGFLGVGAHKIIRDAVYDSKGITRADHIYYKKHGLYDFPQKKLGNRLFNAALVPLLKIPRLRKKLYSNLKKLVNWRLQR